MKRAVSVLLALVLTVSLAPAALGAEGDVIRYTGPKEEAIPFAVADFEAACRQQTGEELDWVSFTLPGAGWGTLWHKLGEKGVRRVDAKTQYYLDEEPALELVSFLPAEGRTGTVTLDYAGESQKDTAFSGQVELTLEAYAGDLTYRIDRDEALTLSGSELDELCRASVKQGLDFIRLEPASQGKLYEQYGTDAQILVKKSTAYYFNKDPNINSVSFVPENSGTATLEYTAYSTGDRSFEGKIRVLTAAEELTGNLEYLVPEGTSVTLGNGKYVDDQMRLLAGTDWKTVQLTPPAASVGVLYAWYGETNQRRVTQADRWTQEGDTSLNHVTFVPAYGVSGKVTVDMEVVTAKGKKVQGLIVFEFGKATHGLATSGGTTGVQPIRFVDTDLGDALKALSTQVGKLSDLKFVSLPHERQGQLWVSYLVPTARSGGRVTLKDSYRHVDNITFVPRAGFRGEAEMTYVVKDQGGQEYQGKVYITVQPETDATKFRDMKRAAWAIPAVEFLAGQGVVEGTSDTAFGPGQPMGRGDFVLMLARAYALTEGQSSTESFADVPTDSYYALAIAAAKAKGIAQSEDGNFDPAGLLTRQEAALLLARTLEYSKVELPRKDGGLAGFTDRGEIAPDAVDAVTTLVEAEILQGDGDGRLNPTATVTRGEMAVLLHRVLTL